MVSKIAVIEKFFKDAGIAYKVPEEDVSKEDLAKQTDVVEKLVKDIISSKLPEYKDKVYATGGFVRDRLLGKNPKDLDLVVDDPEREMESAKDFANKLVDALGIRSANNPHPLKEAYGIWGVALLNPKKDKERKPFIYGGVNINGYVLELTPPRKEGPYDDSKRAPSYVKYTPLEDDSRRRDLTINALYQNITTGKIKDFVGGLDDIKNKKLRPPPHPEGVRKIYEDDPLRLMRIIRFSGKLSDFKIDPDTEKEIKKFISDPEGHKIISEKLSKERIQEEFNKILINPSASKVVEGLDLMRNIGMLKYLSLELDKLYDLYHDNVYHKGESVWQHTMDVISKTPPTLKARLAAFFHDIGKIYSKTEKIDKEGRPRVQFLGHEKHSAAMAEKIMKDLKYSNNEITSVRNIIHAHMGFKNIGESRPETQNRQIRIFIEKLYEDLDDAIALLKADVNTGDIAGVEKLEADIKKMLEEDKKKGIFVEKGKGYKYEVPLSGDELMSLYNLEGQKIGAVIAYLKKFLFEGRMSDPDVAKRKEEAKKILNALMKDKKAFEIMVKKYEESKSNDEFFKIKKSSVSKVLLGFVRYASLRINWVKPNFNEEVGEYQENVETKNFLKSKNIEFYNAKELIKTLGTGSLVYMPRESMQKFENVTWKKEDFEEELKDPEYKQSYDKMEKDLLETKSLNLPAPIILHLVNDNRYWGFSGNRRTNLAFNYNIPLKVWMVKL